MSSKAWAYEQKVVLGMIALYITIGLTLISNSENSVKLGLDAPCYADPAINLALGNGFTSDTWYTQTSQEFWAGNVPLHAATLSVWLKLFGIGHTQLLSFGLALYAMGTLLVWKATQSRNWITNPRIRIGLIGFLLTYRPAYRVLEDIRPDPLAYFLGASVLWAVTIKDKRTRFFTLGATAALCPATSLQLGLAIAVLCTLAALIWKRTFLKESLSIAVGLAAGGIGLITLYASTDSLLAFYYSLAPHTRHVETALNKLPLGQAYLDAIQKPSFLGIIAASFSLIAIQLATEKTANKAAILAIAAAVGVASTSAIVGVFPYYYLWTALLPASILLAKGLEDSIPQARAIPITILAITTLFGAPKTIIGAILFRNSNSKEEIISFVERNINPEDTCLVTNTLYLPAKLRAKRVFYDLYTTYRKTQEADLKEIDVLIVPQKKFDSLMPSAKEQFKPTGEKLNILDRSKSLQRGKGLNFIIRKERYLDLIVFRKKTP